MIPEMAYLGNALLTLLVVGVQMGWFGDIFDDLWGSGSDDDGADEKHHAYDASKYAQEVYGTAGPDAIDADDYGGNIAAFLGAGDDVFNGSSAADFVDGGDGNDTLIGYEGDDVIVGGGGHDSVAAGKGDDIIYGGDGNDTLDGSIGNDTIYGGAGDDMITGGLHDDVIYGGDGNDIISGDRLDSFGDASRGIDILDGGAGDDSLRLTGGDTGTGGTGADTFEIYDTGDTAHEVKVTDYESGIDTIAIVYDETFDPVTGDPITPSLSVTDSADGIDAVISINGDVVAIIQNAAGMQASEIALVAN